MKQHYLSFFLNYRKKIITLFFLFVFIASSTTLRAAIDGSTFTTDNLLRDLKWNQEKGRIEFKVMFYDNFGSAREEGVSRADIIINGVNLGYIYYNCETPKEYEYANCRFWSITSAVNGHLYTNSRGMPSSECSYVTTEPYREQDILYQYYGWFTYSVGAVNDGANYKRHAYAEYFWYPGDISSNETISVQIANVQIKETASGQTKTVPGTLKTVDITVPAAENASITGGNIGSGGNFSVTCSATGASQLLLLKNGNHIDTKDGTNVTFTGKYLTTVDEFLDGVTFSFKIRQSVSDGKTVYTIPAGVTLKSQRAATFGFFNPSLSLGTCGNLNLNWTLANPNPNDRSNVNTEGFDIQYRKNAGNWITITDANIPNCINTGSNETQDYTYSYKIPDAELQAGKVNYGFRIKRKFAEWDDAVYQNFMQTKLSDRQINTNYKPILSTSIVSGKDNYPRISWSFADGIECYDILSCKLKIGSTETIIPIESVKAGYYQTIATDGVLQCTPQQYSLILQYGTKPAFTTVINSAYVFVPTGKREFEDIVVSKGYLSDRVNIKWFIKNGYDEFSTFRVQRRLLTDPDESQYYTTVTQISHTRGVLQYNYDDRDINAGVYYVYRIEGTYSCNDNSGSVYSSSTVGFSQPFGSVSGRVTYTGSVAVKDAVINITSSGSLRSNRELVFSPMRHNSKVTIPSNDKIFSRDGFSFQVWTKYSQSRQDTLVSNDFVKMIRKTDDKLYIEMQGITINTDDALSIGNYTHITVTVQKTDADYKHYNVTVYVDGKQVLQRAVATSTALPPASLSTIGKGVYGTIDDIRIWNTVLNQDDISLNYDRVLSGKETGLMAYYKCDEPNIINDALFDCSALGTAFNGNHATKGDGVERSDVPTSASHLSIKGVTDANGIYQVLNSIPYTSDGTTYALTPSLGIHSFDPNNRPLFFSSDSKVFNNVDFTDISSFPVKGKVTYANTNYPVDSVTISIDGIAASKDGKIIQTDQDGNFEVSVPIGNHFISLSKQGHVFADGGRFPANQLLKHNFQSKVEGLKFYDLTTVKLIGRVAGGTPQTNLPLGYGQSKANIGKATIKLKTVSNQYSLNLTTTDSVVTNNPIGGKLSKTTFKPGHIIEIETNNETGEFSATLPPVPVYLFNVRTTDFEDSFTSTDVVDFTYSKSIFNMNPNLSSTIKYTNPKDGTTQNLVCNDSLKVTRYNDPEIEVSDLGNKVGAFGDSTYVYVEEGTGKKENLRLYSVGTNGAINYVLGAPVLNQQAGQYNWKIKAYERYINKETGATDLVPLDGQVININNALSSLRVDVDTIQSGNPTTLTTTNKELTLDDNGEGKYSFIPGFPNINGDNKLAAKFTFDKNGKTITWEKTAYLLGQVPSDGNNFVTKGPDMVDIVLHDPPGSNSYAFIEKGSSYTTRVSKSTNEYVDFSTKFTIMPLKKISTVVGFGVALIEDIEPIMNITTGVQVAHSSTKNWDVSRTTTFTQQYSTLSDPNYVGSLADVYIGSSTNITFGKVRTLSFFKDNALGIPLGTTGYRLFTKEEVNANMEFGTNFTYSQDYIIETLIPNLKALRNSLLITTSTIPSDGASLNFGTNNVLYFTHLLPSDPGFGNPATYYAFYKPGLPEQKKVDMVQQYNLHVATWEKRIAENEKAKLDLFAKRDVLSTKKEAKLFENISFDAGAHIEKSLEITYDSVYTSMKATDVSGSIGAEAGLALSKVGFKLETEIVAGKATETENGSGSTETVKFGYVFSEDESVVYAGKDALSVDVYGPSSDNLQSLLDGKTIPNLSGFTFRTRAGQTSCPYEPSDSTLYYVDEQGSPLLLNYGTFQIEKPEIYIDSKKEASIENVSSGREGSLTLQLQNNSETNLDVTYQLYVNAATNPDGLVLMLDGQALTAPRQIRIPSGTEITKSLKVKQSNLDVLNYNNVVVRLASICDNNVYSDAVVNASFTPSSSPVALTADKLMASNMVGVKDSIRFTVSDYDRAFKNFACIRLQYKNVTDQNWITLREFVNNEQLDPIAVGDNKELINNRATIDYFYIFTHTLPTDGEYQFRAISVSLIGNTEVTTASDMISIVKDTKAPQLLGYASPTTGILGAGDEISLTFNENIQSNKLTTDMFSITGILNNEKRVEPTVGIAFTGSETASTEQSVYTSNSFSIETWFKRTINTGGTLFSYGSGSDYIALGFDQSGHAVISVGNESYKSSEAIDNTTDAWKYVALTYDRTNKVASVYAFQDAKTVNLFNGQSFVLQPSTQGRLFAGNTPAGDNGFKGALGLLHFYNTARNLADISATKSLTKSGTEPNLIGLWEMTEGDGATATDKARSRTMHLNNASWYIYPQGKSIALNGSSQYVKIPSGTYPFRMYDDFTLEFWFKGVTQGAATLLSCGKSAYIGINDTHQPVLTVGNNTQILSTVNVLDNKWHHLSLSVRRNGLANAMLDGVLASSFNSTFLPENLEAAYYYLGAKYDANNSFTQYFSGNIDELRVWNSALTTTIVAESKNHKLRGTESGLKAYYPFDQYNKINGSVYSVDPTYNDMLTGSSFVALPIAETSIVELTPPVQEVSPLQNVAFTFTASDNKIVFNITEDEYKIDNVTLNITAKNILDIHNNVSSTIAWTAYVNRSSLNWITDKVNLTMQYGDNMAFSASFVNNGSTATNYYIDNLPAWLTTNTLSGKVTPLANTILTFTVAPGINIGNYECVITLKDENGVSRLLPVTLKVTALKPAWSVNPANFSNTMSVIGGVRIDNMPQEDENDLVAAFVGDLCVGIASPQYISSINGYYVFMNVYGNQENENQALTFKVWDASSGLTYSDIDVRQAQTKQTIVFKNGSTRYANLANPVVFNTQNTVQQQIPMTQGWNWFSGNVTNTASSLLTQFKEQLGDNCVLIKSQKNYLEKSNQGSAAVWLGSMTEMPVTEAYMAKLTNEQTLRFEGSPVASASTPITIYPEWNWIGYTPQFSTPVATALSGINAQDGDQIKSQTAFSVYVPNHGWVGTLSSMQPGKGYMYYSQNPEQSTFTYPSVSTSSKLPELNIQRSNMESRWTTNYRQFANNMTITSYLLLDNKPVNNAMFELAAFKDDDCRGNVRMTQITDDLTQNYPVVGFLMVYGDGNEKITFKAYDHQTGKTYTSYNEPVSFTANEVLGTTSSPYMIQLSSTDTPSEDVNVYPNPATDVLNIIHRMDKVYELTLTDMMGRILYVKDKFADLYIDVSGLDPGSYILKLKDENNETKIFKVLKK
jgi:hypothetical protein